MEQTKLGRFGLLTLFESRGHQYKLSTVNKARSLYLRPSNLISDNDKRERNTEVNILQDAIEQFQKSLTEHPFRTTCNSCLMDRKGNPHAPTLFAYADILLQLEFEHFHDLVLQAIKDSDVEQLIQTDDCENLFSGYEVVDARIFNIWTWKRIHHLIVAPKWNTLLQKHE